MLLSFDPSNADAVVRKDDASAVLGMVPETMDAPDSTGGEENVLIPATVSAPVRCINDDTSAVSGTDVLLSFEPSRVDDDLRNVEAKDVSCMVPEVIEPPLITGAVENVLIPATVSAPVRCMHPARDALNPLTLDCDIDPLARVMVPLTERLLSVAAPLQAKSE